MPEKFLTELGFSKNESKVYCALLKIGLSTASEISSATSIHRTNIYDCLERLLDKGLVSYIHKEGKKQYQAANPDKIRDLLREKEQKFSEVLPQMIRLKKSAVNQELVEIYRGMKAVKMNLQSFLKEKGPILVYGIPKIALGLMEDFILIYHKKRILKKVVMKHIYDEDATKRIEQLNKMPYTYAKYLPRMKDSPVSTNICGNEILFILWSENPYIIKIKNKEIASSYKNYFDLLWRISKK